LVELCEASRMFFNKRLFDSKYMLPRDVGNVFTTEDYKALPKEKRERNGFYLVPFGLQINIGELRSKKTEWDRFYDYIRQEYPLQWFARYWLTSWNNPVYAFLKLRYMKFQEVKYTIKRFVKPYFPRWRKSCRRQDYKDICSLIVDSNFALILDFWYEEVINGNVNWESDIEHKTFYNELKKAVKYIEIDRKNLSDKADEELTKATKRKGSYEQKYGKLNKIEADIKTKDTEVLIWFVNNRDFFWS